MTSKTDDALAASARLLAALGWTENRPARVLVFVAHPDDETIGLGAHLAGFADPLIVHATDGAPRNLKDARAQGFADAELYARARRTELEAAVALAGLAPSQLTSLGCPDQQAFRRLPELTRAFAELIVREAPDAIFTHAYEGGHPDHDAVAFVARAALAPLPRPPLLVEMPYYHSEGGVPVRQSFAPGGSRPLVVALGDRARGIKRAMYGAFASQRETVAQFHADSESFRRAGGEDFTAPPNGGEIFYESFGWGLTGAQFVAEARGALASLRLPARL